MHLLVGGPSPPNKPHPKQVWGCQLLTVTPANLVSLLRYLGLPVSCTQLDFSWSSGTDSRRWSLGLLQDVMSSMRGTWSWELCQILFDRIRFKYLSSDILPEERLHAKGPYSLLTVDEYLSEEGFSTSFRESYLSPLLSAFWQMDASPFLPELPIASLVCSLYQNHLLCIHKSAPEWYQVDQGAYSFLQALSRDFPATNIHLGCRVIEVNSNPSGEGRFILITADGQERCFDHIVVAVDAWESLKLLDQIINEEERDILQDLGVSNSVAVLHSDPRVSINPPTYRQGIFN